MVKTLSAGVGIDLVSRSGEIKNITAENLLEKNFLTSSKNEILYEELLESSSRECDRLTENQMKLNTKKRRQLEIYNQLEKSKNKSPINLKSSDPKFLLENYPSDLGACTKKDLINNLNGQNKYKFNNSSKIRNNLYERLPSISSLYIFQRNKFYDMFTGNPLIGSESMFKKYEKEFKNSDIDFNLNCINDNECLQNVKWANPGNAINMASKQFYGRIINKEWDSLGLSYIGFLISILLSFTATILLYTSSIDIRNRASRSDKVQEWASEYLLELDEEKSES